MKGIRHLPLVVLILMLIAAAGSVGIGWLLAREERVEIVESDQAEVTDFAGLFGEEVESLEDRLERTLLGLCREVETDASDRSLKSLAETYAGVRQISLVKTGRLGKGFLFERSVVLDEKFPLPRIGQNGEGELGLKRMESPGVSYYWANGKKGQWYFVSRQGGNASRIVVLGIDELELLETFELWLGKWAGKRSASLVGGGRKHRLVSPGGDMLVENDPGEGRPDTIFPIASRWGAWEVLVWNERRTVVEFQEQILLTAGGVALGFLIIGSAGFWMLRQSVRVATQRVSFVNQVSHELRTPLTNIMLNLDLTKDSLEGNQEAGRRLGVMGEELGRLQRLLENVLTFSNRDKVPKSVGVVLDLGNETRRAMAAMEPSMKRKGIESTLDLEEGVKVTGERDALAQIVGNLLSNVAKYGRENGEVKVKVFSNEAEVTLQVCDSGPGILKRDRERIFKPFFRLSNRVNEGVSGSGLGLAISRKLARDLGGELRCLEREDGQEGACFELVLPQVTAEIVPFETKAS